MPEIYVYAADSRTVDQRRTLAREITDAVVRNFNVPPDVVVVQFVTSPADSKARGGVLFSDRAAAPAQSS